VSGALTTGHRADWDFGRLVEEHFARAVRFCTRLLGNVGEGEDVAQQAFVNLLEKGRRPWEKGDPLPFLYTVLRNACIDHVRRRKRMTAAEVDPQAPAPDLSGAEEREVRDALFAALTTLEPAQHQAILLRFYEGLDLPQVAKAMQRSVGATAMLLTRAKARLKERLGRLPGFES
jgi:RNA polymerase sigma-70 factor (ECF subfamily)